MRNVADGDLGRVGEREAHGHVWHGLDGEAVKNTNRLGVHMRRRNLGDRKLHIKGLGFGSLQCADEKRRTNDAARRLRGFRISTKLFHREVYKSHESKGERPKSP